MSPLRTVAKVVRFSPQELSLIREHAHACGLTAARYIRETALGAVPSERRAAATDEIIRQLARIGNNLNQLAHAANGDGRFPLEARIDAALTVHLDVLKQLR
jgi:hypothetical protein